MATRHARWSDVKQRRPLTPESQTAYEHARRGYQIGLRVRELRVERGLSRAELARRVGTTSALIARIEEGTADPRLDILERVSAAFDLDLVVDFQQRERLVTS